MPRLRRLAVKRGASPRMPGRDKGHGQPSRGDRRYGRQWSPEDRQGALHRRPGGQGRGIRPLHLDGQPPVRGHREKGRRHGVHNQQLVGRDGPVELRHPVQLESRRYQEGGGYRVHGPRRLQARRRGPLQVYPEEKPHGELQAVRRRERSNDRDRGPQRKGQGKQEGQAFLHVQLRRRIRHTRRGYSRKLQGGCRRWGRAEDIMRFPRRSLPQAGLQGQRGTLFEGRIRVCGRNGRSELPFRRAACRRGREIPLRGWIHEERSEGDRSAVPGRELELHPLLAGQGQVRIDESGRRGRGNARPERRGQDIPPENRGVGSRALLVRSGSDRYHQAEHFRQLFYGNLPGLLRRSLRGQVELQGLQGKPADEGLRRYEGRKGGSGNGRGGRAFEDRLQERQFRDGRPLLRMGVETGAGTR